MTQGVDHGRDGKGEGYMHDENACKVGRLPHHGSCAATDKDEGKGSDKFGGS